MIRLRSACIAAILAVLLGAGPLAAAPLTNSVLGGIGGINNGSLDGGDGTGTGQFTIDIVDLALVKQARDPSTGAVYADGANVPSGQPVTFVLFVDNPTDHSAFNISIRDQLDEAAFRYLAGSLETATVPSGSNDATIWNGTWSTLLDPQDADICSAINTSGGTNPEPDLISCGNDALQPNPQIDVPAGTLRAIRFQVEVR